MSVCPKIILLFGMVYLASSIKASSQEIHNVKAEQFQNEMFITYDILNALPSQVYLVKAECIIDNNTFNVSSATGNGFGRVNAGPSRQVIWEIGKDLKPIKSENVSFRILPLQFLKVTKPKIFLKIVVGACLWQIKSLNLSINLLPQLTTTLKSL
jgi:hypothetical protein